MAVFEPTLLNQAGSSFGGRLSIAVQRAVAALTAWNDARSTRKALSSLTDRELDDIGLCRADLQKF